MKPLNRRMVISRFSFKKSMCFLVLTFLLNPFLLQASEWKAGTATAVITPEEPLWLGGLAERKAPSQGIIHDLYVKALALEGAEGNRVVIVTVDLIGISREFSNRVSQEIFKRYGLPRDALLINASHTHCGPEVRIVKIPTFFYTIPEEYVKKNVLYIKWLHKKFVQVIGEALENLKPAALSFSTASASSSLSGSFAVSRRLPSEKGILYKAYTGGPRDDVVPILRVTDADGKIKAILFGFACHPITYQGNEICGDYPGYAQRYIEEAYPGATALFVQGCSGELVPHARHQIEYAWGHGKAIAKTVQKALDSEQIPITGSLKSAYEEVILDIQPVPDRKVLEEILTSNHRGYQRKAAYLLEKLDKN